eukprot:TRINITY_DN42202_c0_g1_i1.p1 TRINITY_DN42202_c0_g1~~TRINITY_DN42202_c0_g1_i1.p1  ORF type:complete len:251 (-),score=24.05 TRINITY_DN42202_c0_g1_i1:118-870(-)
MVSLKSQAAILVATIAGIAAVWDVCPRGPVGSCMVTSCSRLRGPTVCENGQCNCIQGYCRYPNFRIHAQPRRCRAQVPGASCHATRFCYKGGIITSSCVSGRCLCRTGMHIGADGMCHSGWWPDKNDRYCNKDTGGTCRFFRCARSRHAECVAGKCVCGAATCSVNGACTANPSPLPPMNTTTGLEAYTADSESTDEEDFEIAVNVATGVAILAGPTVLLVAMGVVLYRRFCKRATALNERLIDGVADLQ